MHTCPQRRRLWSWLLIPTLLVMLASSAFAAGWEDWTTTELDSNFTGITYGNGLYVVVGEKGAIVTSPDGATWSKQTLSGTYQSVAYGNGKFVAVGAGGWVASSDNATGWSTQELVGKPNLTALAYCNHQFLAFSDTGTLFRTSDGTHWMPQETGSHFRINALTCNDQRIVAVGDGGKIISSAGGYWWDTGESGQPADTALKSVAYGAGHFVAAGRYGDHSIILTSLNGLSWKATDVEYDLASITFTHDAFYAIVRDNVYMIGNAKVVSNIKGVASSTDGVEWSVWNPDAFRDKSQGAGTAELKAIAGGGRGLVAVGDRGAIFHLPVSGAPVRPAQSGMNFATGNGRYVGISPAGEILLSSDLSQWKVYRWQKDPSQRFWASAFLNGRFIVTGDNGLILLSLDNGATWTPQESGTKAGLYAVAVSPTVAVAVGEGGTILTSRDGMNWRLSGADTHDTLVSVQYVNGFFVATGEYGTVLYSALGEHWQLGGNLTSAVPSDLVSEADGSRAARIAIRPADSIDNHLVFESGSRNRFEAIAYAKDGSQIGPVDATWSIVCPISVSPRTLCPVATVDSNGYFSGYGAGTVQLQARFRDQLAFAMLKIIPNDDENSLQVTPPALPPRLTDFNIVPQGQNNKPLHVRVGQPVKLTVQGLVGTTQTSDVLHPYWFLAGVIDHDTFHFPETSKSLFPEANKLSATIDADGTLTVYGNLYFQVGAVFANGIKLIDVIGETY